VSSKDKASGKTQSITVQSSGGLSEAEIQNMIKNADSMKEADKLKRVLTVIIRKWWTLKMRLIPLFTPLRNL
jgi:molecular chaperone DnaK (HSP70)